MMPIVGRCRLLTVHKSLLMVPSLADANVAQLLHTTHSLCEHALDDSSCRNPT